MTRYALAVELAEIDTLLLVCEPNTEPRPESSSYRPMLQVSVALCGLSLLTSILQRALDLPSRVLHIAWRPHAEKIGPGLSHAQDSSGLVCARSPCLCVRSQRAGATHWRNQLQA